MTRNAQRFAQAALPALALWLGGTAPTLAEDGVIRVGITFRMVVENGLKYGQMAKDELEAVNATGGINGKKIEVFLLDDECKPDKGIANVNRLIHQNKVHVVLGSTCSSVSMPMVDVTAKEEMPQLVTSSTNTSITRKNSNWVFRTAISERFFVALPAKYMSENAGKKVAYLYTTDGAGLAFAKEYMGYMKKNYNVDPVYDAQMQETDLDFRAHLLKIKSLNPEVLAIGGQHEALARIMQQALEVGIPTKNPARGEFGSVECSGAGAGPRRRQGTGIRRGLQLHRRASRRAGFRQADAREVRHSLPGPRCQPGL